MTSTETIIHHNQRTIACIDAQDYTNAVVSSQSSLQFHGNIAAIHQRELIIRQPSRSEVSYDQCMLLTNMDMSNDDETEDHCFIYSYGIPLPTTWTEPDTITPILIFNTALAYHLLARQHSNNETSTICLRKAYRLYALAYDAADLDENPLFRLAVINNAAVIDRQLGNNMEPWNASMGYLLSLYMFLVDRGCFSRLRQVRGFLANAMPSSPVAHGA